MASEDVEDLSSSVFNVENFDPQPDEELICSICRCVFNDPVECTCRHVFCRNCISSWLMHKKSCPICRKRTYAFELETVTPIIKNMISKLTLNCPNKTNGCEEKLILDGYHSHIKHCPCEIVLCKNVPCIAQCRRIDLELHESSECKFRTLNCPRDCKLLFPASKLKDHNCVDELKKVVEEKDKSITTFKNQVEELTKELESLKKKNRVDQEREAANNRSRSPPRGAFSILDSSDSSSSSSSSSSLSDSSLDSFHWRSNFYSFNNDRVNSTLNMIRNILNEITDQTRPITVTDAPREVDSDADTLLNFPINTDAELTQDEADESRMDVTNEPSNNESNVTFMESSSYSNPEFVDNLSDEVTDERIPTPAQRRILKRRNTNANSLVLDSDDSDSSDSTIPIPPRHRRRFNATIDSDTSESSSNSSSASSSSNSYNSVISVTDSDASSSHSPTQLPKRQMIRSLVPLPEDSDTEAITIDISSSDSEISSVASSESSYEVQVPERTWDLLQRYNENSDDTSEWRPSDY